MSDADSRSRITLHRADRGGRPRRRDRRSDRGLRTRRCRRSSTPTRRRGSCSATRRPWSTATTQTALTYLVPEVADCVRSAMPVTDEDRGSPCWRPRSATTPRPCERAHRDRVRIGSARRGRVRERGVLRPREGRRRLAHRTAPWQLAVCVDDGTADVGDGEQVPTQPGAERLGAASPRRDRAGDGRAPHHPLRDPVRSRRGRRRRV